MRNWTRSGWALAAGAGLSIGAAGCEKIPDTCADFKLACVAVTIESGPAALRQLRVIVNDGKSDSTLRTPKRASKTELTYPLRFAVRFGQFDNFFRGYVTLDTTAYNEDFDVIGQTQARVDISGTDKKTLTIALQEPLPMDDMDVLPDLGGPDLVGAADLATTGDGP